MTYLRKSIKICEVIRLDLQLKVRIYPLFRVMEVQRTCEVTATPVEYVKARCTCERAGRCQPERGADEYGNSGKLLDRAIRGFEDLLFSSPQLLRTFFLPLHMGARQRSFAVHEMQCPL